MKKLTGKIQIDCFLVSFLLCFLVFAYGPTQIYISNYLDFNYNITDVWKYMLPLCSLFTIIGAVALICLFRVNSTAGHFFSFIGTGIILALFIEGNYLASALPVLDGSEIKWESYRISRLLSAAVWIGCFVISFVCFYINRRKSILKEIRWINVAVLMFLVVSLFVSCIADQNIFRKKSDATMTAEGLMTMSNKENFVVFLLDSMNETAFENLLMEDSECQETFKDFTAFTNTMCMYPYTNRSVPYILFGKIYDNSLYYRDYLNQAADESPFMKQLKHNGYDVRVYSDILQACDISGEEFQNFMDMTKFKYPDKFCKMILKLTALRYAPFDFKRYCVVTPEDIYYDTLKKNETKEEDYYSSNNRALYLKIKNEDISLADQPCYRFIYADGAHVPWKYDGKMNEIEGGTYMDGMNCSVFLAKSYLDKIKAEGVYDNTAIVILADHGVNLANPMGQENKQHPVMLIKGRNEHHDLKMNDAPVSHADLQMAYIKLLNGDLSETLFDFAEGEERTRTYLYSDAGIEADLIEYETDGHARDMGAMHPTGKVFAYSGDS